MRVVMHMCLDTKLYSSISVGVPNYICMLKFWDLLDSETRSRWC